MPHTYNAEGHKLVCLHLHMYKTIINAIDNQNLNAYICQKTIVNAR